MPNKNYKRSYSRERDVKLRGEKEKWFAIRASGSHGIADVVWIRPRGDGHFEVKFIQIKVSEKYVEKKIEKRYEKTPFGLVEVEYWMFPVKKKS